MLSGCGGTVTIHTTKLMLLPFQLGAENGIKVTSDLKGKMIYCYFNSKYEVGKTRFQMEHVEMGPPNTINTKKSLQGTKW